MLWSSQASVAANHADVARQAETLIFQQLAAERTRLAPAAPALAQDATLSAIARTRSQAMAEGAPFSHRDASGKYPAFDMVREELAPFHGAIGENIMTIRDSGGIDADAFARKAVEGWMASPEHRANILSRDYNRAGIGVAVKGDRAYATEVFAGPPLRANRTVYQAYGLGGR